MDFALESDTMANMKKVLHLFATLSAYLLVSPLFLVYHTARNRLFGPAHSGWGFGRDFGVASLLFLQWLATCFGKVPPNPLSEDAPASSLSPPKKASPDFLASDWAPTWFTRRLTSGLRVTPVRVPAADDKWICGIARAGDGVVRAVEVPGFWVEQEQEGISVPDRRAADGERVTFHLASRGRHAMSSPIARDLARLPDRPRTFTIPLRRPAPRVTSRAFPAQLLDALAGFCYLTKVLGFDPRAVVLVAESEGAVSALALLRYLGELREQHGVDLGMPGSVVLISPECNFSRIDRPIVRTDYRTPHYRRWLVPALAAHFPLRTLSASPYFAPAFAGPGAFSHLCAPRVGDAEKGLESDVANNEEDGGPSGVRVWIQFSSCELFVDDIRALATRMRADGVHVAVDEIVGGLHVDATWEYDPHGTKNGSRARFMAAVDHLIKH